MLMKKEEIERCLITSYRKDIYRPFTKAVMDYNLIEEGDHICVCISGGKDSFILAKCMQEIEKHGKYPIKCEYVVMNPGFGNNSMNGIKLVAEKLGIDIKIINSDIFEHVKKSGHKSPCYVCAKMRRGCLYNIAKELGCNKIALGHHFDDVIETTMMSLLYNGVFNTMLPKVNSENFDGMKLIRPLYLVREKSIINFAKKIDVEFSKCNCPLKDGYSKRSEVKKIIEELKKENEFVEYNIFKSSENVDLNNIRGFFKDKKHYNFSNIFDNDIDNWYN